MVRLGYSLLSVWAYDLGSRLFQEKIQIHKKQRGHGWLILIVKDSYTSQRNGLPLEHFPGATTYLANMYVSVVVGSKD